MQDDGNFVVYDSNSMPTWASGTGGNMGNVNYSHGKNDLTYFDFSPTGAYANICTKKQWASITGVIWDGVTNYNKCDVCP